MKKTNKFEDKIMKKLAEKIEKDTKAEVSDWPPICTYYLHQPKRPEIKNN